MATWSKVLLGVILLSGSCNDEDKTTATASPDSVNIVKTAVEDTISSGCYSQIVQRDTSLLEVENNKSIIAGALSYNIYQKDRNDGSFQGELSGDTLKGWYLFRSEGIISVRQVAWKIKGDQLWPGMGEMVQRKDTMLFSQPGMLKFDSIRPFVKVPCIL